jgi:hypothetical protein
MLFGDHLLKLLPAKSREKVVRLEADREAAHAAYRAASDREREARNEFLLRQSIVARQIAEMGPVAALNLAEAAKATEERNQRLIADLEPLERRHEAAVTARDRAAEAWEKFAFLEDCASWLSNVGAGVTLTHFAVPAPKAPRGFAAKVDEIRLELGALEEQWIATENAPAPADELLRRAIAEIDAVAEQGALTINPRTRSPRPLRLAERLTLGSMGQSGAALIGDGGGPLFIWLMRDALVERVKKLIAELPQGGALSDIEREKRFAEIAARRLELERMEEACICEAEKQGQLIPRRRDADPRAVLEVAEA